MIEKMSDQIVAVWSKQMHLSQEDAACYRYGVELCLSTLINVFGMLIIAIILQDGYLFVIYNAVYIPLRIRAGGYHAARHVTCILYSVGSFALAGCCIHLVNGCRTAIFAMLVALFTCVIIYLRSPIEHENNRLSDQEKAVEHRAAVGTSGIILIVVMVLILLSDSVWAGYIAMSELSFDIAFLLACVRSATADTPSSHS